MSATEPCVIGKGARFEGKISFNGDARIEGQARGEIRGDGTLVVEESGIVEANVTVGRLIVHGSVRGDVRLKEGLSVGPHGRIEGQVATPRLQVAEGATLQARIEMGETPPAS